MAALILSSCSTTSLMCGGKPEEAASLDQRVARETCRATYGDKQYQYEVGRRFWEGDGVPQDRQTAIEWLEKAASPIDKSRSYVYVPPVGSQKYGTVQGFDMPGEPGNFRARMLLEEILQTPAENDEPAPQFLEEDRF